MGEKHRYKFNLIGKRCIRELRTFPKRLHVTLRTRLTAFARAVIFGYVPETSETGCLHGISIIAADTT